jgi:uncharacterized protein YwqG
MKTIDQIKVDLKSRGIPSELVDKIGDSYMPCYQLISLGDEDYAKIGNSRAGGLPDLPDNENWPLDSNGVGLYFVAQINLADLSHQAIPYLPKRGILYFFINQWSWQDNKVIYFNGDFSLLKKAKIDPSVFEKDPLNAPEGVCKIGFELAPNIKLSLDFFTPQEVDDFLHNRDKQIGAYMDIVENLCFLRKTKIGGWVNNPPGPEAINHLSYYQKEAPSYLLDENKWHVLLYLETDFGDIESFYWVDGRKLVFGINEDDLKNRNFVNVYSYIADE